MRVPCDGKMTLPGWNLDLRVPPGCIKMGVLFSLWKSTILDYYCLFVNYYLLLDTNVLTNTSQTHNILLFIIIDKQNGLKTKIRLEMAPWITPLLKYLFLFKSMFNMTRYHHMQWIQFIYQYEHFKLLNKKKLI